MLEWLHFVVGVVWAKVPKTAIALYSVELIRIVAERGKRSRGGHLCFVLCHYYYNY